MTSINTFQINVYSEELFPGISEADYNEVMTAPTVEDGWQGYSEWSTELEQGEVIETQHGAILINRSCSHVACKTTKCERGATFEGIAI
jgi:hypothetical protein